MKILFITENIHQAKIYPPFWAMALSYLAKLRGHTTAIFDMSFDDRTNDELAEYLKRTTWDIICHSPVSTRFVEISIPLSKVINANKRGALYIIGGSAVSANPKYHRIALCADISVVGDIYTKRVKEKIGFDYDLVDMKAYSERTEGYIGFIASTGCPGKCIFCYRVTEGYHPRDIKKVVDEMRMLSCRCGSVKFDILDNLFVTKKNLKEFKKEMDGWKPILVVEARADMIDQEVCDLMKDVGVNFCNVGMESQSPYVLKEIGKGTTPEQNDKAARLLTDAGIAIGCNFIVGFENDDTLSFQKNVEFIRTFNTVQVRTLRPVTFYPGTAGFKKLGKTCEDFYRDFKNIDLVTWKTMRMPTEKFYYLLTHSNNLLLKTWAQRGIISEITYREYFQQLYDLYTGKTPPEEFHGFSSKNKGEHK